MEYVRSVTVLCRAIAAEHSLCSYQWMSERQHWSDEVVTEQLPVRDSRQHAQHRRAHAPLWSMKLLFIVVTVAVVVVSVAVAWQMSHRSATHMPTADARRGDCLTWP